MEIMTHITRVLEVSGKKARILLAENPFRPAGGGQPGDSGRIEGDDLKAEVTDCQIEADGEVLFVRLKKGCPEEGMAVTVRVDEERKTLLTRMHSGQHILSKVLENMPGGPETYKTAIGDEESSISVTYGGELDWELLFRAEEETNALIARDIPVEVLELPREEARAMEDLKANWDRIEDPTITVVRMGDFDVNACCGSHVTSTGEVGGMLVTGFNGSSPEWTISFTVLRDEKLQAFSRTTRRLLREVGCPLEKVERVYEKLRAEKDHLSKQLDRVRSLIRLPWTVESREGFRFHYAEMRGLDPELVTPAVKRLIEEEPDALALVLIPEEGGRARFLVAHGASVDLDLQKGLKAASLLKARGGGTAGWISGMAGNANLEDWKKII